MKSRPSFGQSGNNRPLSGQSANNRPSSGQFGNNRPSASISNSNQQVGTSSGGRPSNNGNGQLGSQRPSSGRPGNNRPSGSNNGGGSNSSQAFANQSFNGGVGQINHCTNKNKCSTNNGGSPASSCSNVWPDQTCFKKKGEGKCGNKRMKKFCKKTMDKIENAMDKMDKHDDDKEGSGPHMEGKFGGWDEKRRELQGKIKMEMDRAMNKTGNLDDIEKENVMERLEKMKKPCLISWIHSHVRGMECSFSSIDNHTQHTYAKMYKGVLGLVIEIKTNGKKGIYDFFEMSSNGRKAIEDCSRKKNCITNVQNEKKSQNFVKKMKKFILNSINLIY